MKPMATITQTFPLIEQDRQNESKTSWFMEQQELCSPHFLAQDLNNQACSLISRGKNIRRAIQLLVRALELSRWSPQDEDDESSVVSCLCEHCSIDSCLFHGNEECNSDCDCELYDINSNLHNKRRRTRSQRDHYHNQNEDDLDETKGFVYRRPLRVSQKAILDNHYMGSTLTVMVLFNLALAHQLLGMSIPSKWPSFEDKMKNLDKALKLYELCVHACPGCNCSDAAALRLKLLVMNNLSQIHKVSGYPKKYRMCLEYLLRALMFVSHGREGGWEHDYEILTPSEIDAIYRNMQSSSMLMGNQVHAGAA